MGMTVFAELPLTPSGHLGPYRRADYARLPDEPRCELIYGRLYLSPSPLLLHQVIVAEIWRRLHEVATATGGLAALAPLDVHLADHSVVQPDVLYVAPENRAILQDWIEGNPDLSVEVLSPGTARRDRGEKLKLYAESGVREYWIVDPAERQIEFFTLRGDEFVVALPAGQTYRSRVLPEIEFDLVDFWRSIELTLPRSVD